MGEYSPISLRILFIFGKNEETMTQHNSFRFEGLLGLHSVQAGHSWLPWVIAIGYTQVGLGSAAHALGPMYLLFIPGIRLKIYSVLCVEPTVVSQATICPNKNNRMDE